MNQNTTSQNIAYALPMFFLSFLSHRAYGSHARALRQVFWFIHRCYGLGKVAGTLFDGITDPLLAMFPITISSAMVRANP